MLSERGLKQRKTAARSKLQPTTLMYANYMHENCPWSRIEIRPTASWPGHCDLQFQFLCEPW